MSFVNRCVTQIKLRICLYYQVLRNKNILINITGPTEMSTSWIVEYGFLLLPYFPHYTINIQVENISIYNVFKCITVVMYIMTVNIYNYWLTYMVACLYDMFTGDAAYIQLSYICLCQFELHLLLYYIGHC